MGKSNVHFSKKFTLELKSKKYQGKTYEELVGFVNGERTTTIITIGLVDGKVKFYKGEKSGKHFVYARMTKIDATSRDKSRYD